MHAWLVLIGIPITIMGAETENQESVDVKVRTEGVIKVEVLGAVHLGFDDKLSVSELYDVDKVYLRIHNLGSEKLRMFWHSNVNSTFYDLSAIWFVTADYIVEMYGNIWRGYDGGYFSESGDWFESLPTAGWMLWPSGYKGEIRLRGNGILNAHFILQYIQPAENASANFTLTLSAY